MYERKWNCLILHTYIYWHAERVIGVSEKAEREREAAVHIKGERVVFVLKIKSCLIVLDKLSIF